MSGSEIGPVIAVVKLVVERAAPTGWKWFKSITQGKTIAVVGPPGSGKSTFVDYLRFGVLRVPEPHEKTYEPNASPRFNLTLGPSKNLQLIVKSVVDFPGQAPDISRVVFEQRPDVIVIMLDLSAPINEASNLEHSSAHWLEEFLTRLDNRWHNSKSGRNKLRSIFIIMNKADLVDDARVKDAETTYRDLLKRHFRSARGPRFEREYIKKCILVENTEDSKLVDSILFDMAKSVTR